MSHLLSRISSLDYQLDEADNSDANDDDTVGSDSNDGIGSIGERDMIRSDMATEASFEPAGAPPTMVGIPGEDVCITDQDTLNHTEIIQKYMADMISSCQVHFMDVKRRLIEEKEFTLRSRDAFYTEHLTRQQQIIEKLNEDLSRTENDKAYESRRLNLYLGRTFDLYGRRLLSHVSEYSTLKIFYRWKGYVAERVRLTQMVTMANKFVRRSILKKVFSVLSKEYYERVMTKRENESKFRFEGTARVMVERYEAEICRLQTECDEAQAALRQESYRRQQLEEDLRRMFLKNMTVMNMEALSLFQSPNTGPPQLAHTPQSNYKSIMETVDTEYVSCSKIEQQSQNEEMKYQQQTLQQHRVSASVASQLAKVVRPASGPPTSKPRVARGRVDDNDSDLFPRARAPPAPVRHMHNSDPKVNKSAGLKRV